MPTDDFDVSDEAAAFLAELERRRRAFEERADRRAKELEGRASYANGRLLTVISRSGDITTYVIPLPPRGFAGFASPIAEAADG